MIFLESEKSKNQGKKPDGIQKTVVLVPVPPGEPVPPREPVLEIGIFKILYDIDNKCILHNNSFLCNNISISVICKS